MISQNLDIFEFVFPKDKGKKKQCSSMEVLNELKEMSLSVFLISLSFMQELHMNTIFKHLLLYSRIV